MWEWTPPSDGVGQLLCVEMAPNAKNTCDAKRKSGENVADGQIEPKRRRREQIPISEIVLSGSRLEMRAMSDVVNSKHLHKLGLSLLADDSNDAFPESTPPTTLHHFIQKNVNYSPVHCESAQDLFLMNSFDFEGTEMDKIVATESTSDIVSHIADEVILHIFKWLSKATLVRCARVCKKWSRIALDEALWRRVDMGLKSIKSGTSGVIIKRGVHILRLAKSTINEPIFANYTLKTCQLQYLDLSMASITASALSEMLKPCIQLRKLSLEHCSVDDKVCAHIGANKQLDTLNLAMCDGITKKGLLPILKGCSKLKALNISWTHLNHSALFALAEKIPVCIERLNIAGFRNVLTNDVIVNLVERCTQLVEFDISDSGLLTSAILDCLRKLPHLQHLALSRCYNINALQLFSLQNLPKLKSLQAFGFFERSELETVKVNLKKIALNATPLSTIARPTTGDRCTSIWDLRVRG